MDKKALGRGLSALISANPITYDNNNDQIPQLLVIDNISPNPYQPRKEFKAEELGELAGSIREYGILQPILVRKHNNSYQIIAGERRWQAAKKVGLTEIPVIIKDFNDAQMFEVALVENIQRESLNAIEEATAYKKLTDDYKMTQEQVAQKVGKSRSYIANTIRLLNLSNEIKHLVITGKISASHARNLVGKDNASEIASRVVSDNLSVRDVEMLNKKQHKLPPAHPSPYNQSNTDLEEIAQSLSNNLGMNVTIKDDHKGGKLTIHFSTLEQLDTLIQKLGSSGLNF